MMKKETFYVYTNTDELNRFLVLNMIFPLNQDAFSSSISMMKENCIYVTKRKFSKQDIIDNCQISLFNPVVLEVNIPLELMKNVSLVGEKDYLVLEPISCCDIVKIYAIDQPLPTQLYKDLYMFPSLKTKEVFPFGEDELLINDILNVSLNNDLNMSLWSKVQAFYCARYGVIQRIIPEFEEVKKGKKSVKKAKRTNRWLIIDDDDKENEYITFNTKEFQQGLLDFYEATLTDVADAQIDLFKNDYLSILEQVVRGEKEEGFFLCLFKLLLNEVKSVNYNDEPIDLISLIKNSYPEYKELCETVEMIEQQFDGNIFELKMALNDNKAIEKITLYLLHKIMNKGMKEATNFVSNFILEKEEFDGTNSWITLVRSLYGLAKGMSEIPIDIKMKPDILLYAYLKTKELISNKIIIYQKEDYRFYLSLRGYKTQYFIPNLFDLRIEDAEFEYDYVVKKELSEFEKFAKQLNSLSYVNLSLEIFKYRCSTLKEWEKIKGKKFKDADKMTQSEKEIIHSKFVMYKKEMRK